MAKHAPALWFILAAVFAGCSQPPLQTRDIDSPQARYVDVATLTSGDEYSGVDVLTSVPLQHITAADAVAGLEGNLPEGVLMGRTGQSKQILLQGPGKDVVEAIKTLKKLDVR